METLAQVWDSLQNPFDTVFPENRSVVDSFFLPPPYERTVKEIPSVLLLLWAVPGGILLILLRAVVDK
jgi:hypothetical protein